MEIPTIARWSLSKRIAFRFFFLFFAIYFISGPPDYFIPEETLDWYLIPFHLLIPWIGKNILHLTYDITVFTNGSGDTTYDYVLNLFMIFFGIIGAIAWTLLDRKRQSYNVLYYWLAAAVRYYLAFTMFSYGFDKVYQLQFQFPSGMRLAQTYGESSPQGLLWTFMGYSKGYKYFIGFAEIIGGILLLYRRTVTLGAAVSLAVLINVIALNYCYDVPVKLFSTALGIMCVFLLAKDSERLVNFFILHKPTVPAISNAPKFKKGLLNISAIAFKYLLIAFVLYKNISEESEARRRFGIDGPKPPLHGMYSIETFIKNKDTLLPLTTDTVRWNKMYVSYYPNRAVIKMMNDSLRGYVFKPDTTTKKIEMYSFTDTTRKSIFNYSNPSHDILLLSGKWKSDSVVIRMKEFPLKNFLLVNRGFHWINEYSLIK